MSPHRTPRRKRKTFASLIALSATLLATSLGLAACGGSSSTTTTTTQTAANAAATGTTTAGTGTTSTSTGTSSTGKTSSGTSTTGTTASGNGSSPQFTAIRSCLAKKGITVPQSHPLANAQLPAGVSRSQFYTELRACAGGLLSSGSPNHFRKGAKGFHNPFNNPRFHTTLEHFAACMRQNGINVGEPNTSGKGPVFDTKGLNTGSAQFKEAEAKCRSTLLYALQPNHARPGTSGTTTSG